MSDVTIGQKSPAHMTSEEGPFFQINRVTHVYRAYVLAALTRPLARRVCRLRPPPQ